MAQIKGEEIRGSILSFTVVPYSYFCRFHMLLVFLWVSFLVARQATFLGRSSPKQCMSSCLLKHKIVP